ncbi:MAG: Fic family protein [Oscillospiraceae bacterium]|nr:Fic family protein [Oscillospiraceae bacterium]
MSKQSLYKLFYMGKDEYDREYEKRFNSEDTVHLNIMIGNDPAFFEQTAELYKLVASIERADKRIDKLERSLPEQAVSQFAMRCLIDEIMLTNDIEGVSSTRKEIDEVLSNLSDNDKKLRFKGLVMKYIMLIENKYIDISSCKDIRKIYDDIFMDEIKESDPDDLPDGKIFRKNSVSVYSATGKEIHHGIMPESRIIETMDSSLKTLRNDNIEMLFRIALFHYLFGYIHPFYDGNGRTSRFIISYLLSRELNPLIGYRISYTIKENINRYYDAFKICNHPNNKGDLTPFIAMFLGIIDISEKQLCNALEERKNKLDYYRDAVWELPHNNDTNVMELYFALIQAALFSDKGISLRELEEALDVSYNTIQKRLHAIPEKFIIRKHSKRQVYYMADLDEIDKYLK